MQPISSLLAIFSFLLVLIGVLKTSSVEDPRYSDCRTPLACGKIENIGYPFWGMNRSSYCGRPGMELKCEDDVAKIMMIENTLRVLDIDPERQILKVAREDYWNGYCPTELIDTTIDFDHLNYGSNLRNLTLFYGCYLPATWPLIFHSNCSINDTRMDVSYATRNVLGDPRPGVCRGSVVVPIYETAARYLEVNPTSVGQALRGGFELQWKVDNEECRRCSDSDGVCGYNETSNSFICFCSDQPSETTCSPATQGTSIALSFICFCSDRPSETTCSPATQAGNKKGVNLGLILGLGVTGAAAIVVLLVRQQRRNKTAARVISRDLPTSPSSKGQTTSTANTSQTNSSHYTSKYEDIERGSTYFGVHVYNYEELEEATDNFNPSKQLGEGGFGTVFYGVLKDGRVVAVKRLYENNLKRVDQYMNEIEILTLLRHPNLVTLYGCTSRRSRELLLVYEYISNGTVADHLHGKGTNSGSLTWHVRLSIAIETATALTYLHKKEIIHRDVKSNNILLEKNFHVKVADFGLSRLFPTDVTHVSTAPQGTPGYVDPEYHQCYHLTEKSDVYSFGVVLVELVSAKKAVDISRHRHDIILANMAISRIQNQALHELVDPSLGFELDCEVKNSVTAVAELAFRCVQQERELRPSMEEVLETLREIKDVVDIRSDDVGQLKNIPPLSPDYRTDKS